MRLLEDAGSSPSAKNPTEDQDPVPPVRLEELSFMILSIVAIIFGSICLYCIYRHVFGEEDDKKAVAPVSVRNSSSFPASTISDRSIESLPVHEQQQFVDAILARAGRGPGNKYVV